MKKKEKSLKRLNEDLFEQLKLNSLKIEDLNLKETKEIEDWEDFFRNLNKIIIYAKEKFGEKHKVIFSFDEITWLNGKKDQENDFKNQLSNFWNYYILSLNNNSNIKLIITGSNIGWIVKKIIQDKGGFHGRLTGMIYLKPFDLIENYLFFKKNIRSTISFKESIYYYMAFGGVAYYLNFCSSGFFEEDINLFYKTKLFETEFENIFQALFENKYHLKIMEILSKNKGHGFTTKEIQDILKIKNSKSIKQSIEELKLSGFIKEVVSFNSKEIKYYLNDLFCYFYFKWIEKNKSKIFDIKSRNFEIWSGFAFELICFNQIELIKYLGGFSDVETKEYYWIKKGKKENKGNQIDLIIERQDNYLEIVEIKFHEDRFIINEKENNEIKEKIDNFILDNQNKKSFKKFKIRPLLIVLNDVLIKENFNLLNSQTKIIKIKDLIFE